MVGCRLVVAAAGAAAVPGEAVAAALQPDTARDEPSAAGSARLHAPRAGLECQVRNCLCLDGRSRPDARHAVTPDRAQLHRQLAGRSTAAVRLCLVRDAAALSAG